MNRLGALLLAAAVLLCGCSGRQMEEELLVIAMGLDLGEDGGMRLAVKAPAAAQQQDEEKGYLTLEAEGRSFAEAMMLLHASTPRKLNFSQVREVIVNAAAAFSPAFSALLSQLAALPRMRGAAALVVCEGGACGMVRLLKPYMGLRLSRYTDDSLADSSGKGFTPAATLASCLRDLGSTLKDPMLIRGEVNAFSQPAGGAPLSAPAGRLPRKSADPIDLFGAAATDGEKMTGWLSGDETALLHLLTGGGHFYALNLTGQPVTLYARGPAELSVRLTEKPARLTVRLVCDVRCAPGLSPDEGTLKAQTEEKIRALIRRLQALDCDALGFGERAVRGYLFLRDWEKADFKRRYREAEADVSLTLRFRAD